MMKIIAPLRIQPIPAHRERAKMLSLSYSAMTYLPVEAPARRCTAWVTWRNG